MIFVSVCLLSLPTIAQNNWEEKMLESDANFFEIRDAFNDHWDGVDPEKGQGYKQFKRWENFWETRIMPDGSFPMRHKEIWAEFRSTLLNSAPVKSGGIGNWSPIGPYDFNNTDSWSAGLGRVNAIVEDPNDPNTIYIGAPAGGIWKTTDGAATWTPLGDEFSVIGVSAIAIDPNNSNIIYVGTGDSDGGDTYSIGIMKSTDAGATWANVGSVSANETSDIIVDPSNSNIVYVATNAGLLKSTDGASTFTNILNQSIRDIEMKPGVSSTVYAVDANDFYVSTDGGNNWNNTTTGLPNNAGRFAIAVTPANANYVYLLASETNWSFNGIYRSTNSGTSFTAMNTTTDIFESTQAWYDMAIGVSDTDEDIVYTGVLNVWRSTNGGSNFTKVNNWNQPNAGDYTHADIHFLRYYNGALYCGSDGGIFKSTNANTGNTNQVAFTDLSFGLQIGQFYRLGSSQNDVNTLAGGLQDNGGYAYVGGQWKNYYGADGMEAGVHPTNSNVIYGMIQYGDVYRSTDGGNSNGYVGSPEAGRWVTPMQMDENGQRIVAGYNDLHEYNFTTGWNQLSTFNFGELLRSIELYDANSNIMFVGTNNEIYRTTDNGANFTDITGTLPTTIILTSIEVNPSNSDELWVTYGGWSAGSHVYHTTDGGTTWNNITGALPNLPTNIVKYDPAGAGGIYVGTDIGVYYRDNSTGVWVEYNNNLPNVIVNDLEINYANNVIRAGTYGRGVWSSDVYTINNFDVGISAVIVPEDSYCNENSFDPIVTLTNYGQETITDVDITYDIDGVGPLTYSWTGSLAQGQSADVTLPTMSTTSGSHTFNVSTSMPNGVVDEESNNDGFTKNFTVVLGGVEVTFNLIPDCWGSEVTWEVLDGGGSQVLSGGPYSDGTQGILVSEIHCIVPDCYDFNIYDAYGDGMYGSQWGSCNDDGYYNMTNSAGDTLMEIIAVNSDYGSVENNSFCVASVLTASVSANSTSVCEGETIDFSDVSLGTPTSWEWSFPGGSPASSTNQNPTGIIYNTPGTYDVQLIVNDGVSIDTVIMVGMITVNGNSAGSETLSSCESYTWSANSTTYTSSGTYTATLTNMYGCDSTATLNLTINNATSGSEPVSACGTYTWSANSNTYTSSGTYTSTLIAINGCDSVATLNLTIGNANSGSENVSACNTYTWSANSQTYTSSGSYSTTLTNVEGCDSVATLNLTINTPTGSSQVANACNTYTWSENGQTYTSSGTYNTVLTDINGCDSTITLNLTISTDEATTEDVTACGSYTWSANGQTYTANGTYVETLTNINGCDSVVTLNLTISTTAATTQNESACDSYTWSANGQTYTSSGTYVETVTSSTGCDSTVTLNLTINIPTTGSESATSCDTYTWGANGQTYTSSGTYTATLLNAAGCDSVITLNLTINNSEIGATETVSACNSYLWTVNGQTYTSSGTYTSTLTNVNGCDSLVTLDLTVGVTNSGSESITSCDSYTWAANGNTYTNSGSYSANLTNQEGCDSTAILNLTITNSSSSSVNATECESFTWAVDGNTYNSSGTYTAVLQNQAGCDSTITLNLTINAADSVNEVVETCDSFFWDVNGQTYTSSGQYNESFTNVNGCDSIRYLDLTINTVNVGVTVIDDTVLQANAVGAEYQWIDCGTNNPINGETNQIFNPSSNGSYAVQVIEGSCIDTSACITISILDLVHSEFEEGFELYPNPTIGNITIEFGSVQDEIELSLINTPGQIVRHEFYSNTDKIEFMLTEAPGVYFVKIASGSRQAYIKVLKE
jgi:hypothetical protein